MRKSYLLLSVALVVVGLTFAGCGSSPTSPSSSKGVTLHGVALGSGSAMVSASRVHTMSDGVGGTITVTVEGTSITTTISGNGTFELEGLPSGSFTLTFTKDGVVLGSVTVNGVPSETDIKIVVQVNTTTVILIKLDMGDGQNESDSDKTCAISGGKVGSGIELEGNVSAATGSTFTMQVNGERASAAVTVSASAASFKCNGPKSSDNGKKGGGDGASGTCDATGLTVGAKVHVSGTLTTCSTTDATVTATQVMIQKEGND